MVSLFTCCTSICQVSTVVLEAPGNNDDDDDDDDDDNGDDDDDDNEYEGNYELSSTRMSLTLPYSDSFQRILASSHS